MTSARLENILTAVDPFTAVMNHIEDRRIADWIQRFNSSVKPKYQHTTANHTHVKAKGANGGMTIPAPSNTALATVNFIEKHMWIRLFRQLFDHHPNGSGRSKNSTKEGSEGKLVTGAEVPFAPQPNGHTNGPRHGECHAGKPQERAGF